MKIVEIASLPNGAHRSQTGNFNRVPKGYVEIPDGMDLPQSFPFAELKIEDDRLVSMKPMAVPALDETIMPQETNEKDVSGSLLYVVQQFALGKAIDDDDKKLRASALFEDWASGKHTSGELYNAAGQTWECVADYDNEIDAEIVPGNDKWFDYNRALHGKTPETARPYVNGEYKKGEFALDKEGNVFECEEDTKEQMESKSKHWTKKRK